MREPDALAEDGLGYNSSFGVEELMENEVTSSGSFQLP
jgi:hypothetical protein